MDNRKPVFTVPELTAGEFNMLKDIAEQLYSNLKRVPDGFFMYSKCHLELDRTSNMHKTFASLYYKIETALEKKE